MARNLIFDGFIIIKMLLEKMLRPQSFSYKSIMQLNRYLMIILKCCNVGFYEDIPGFYSNHQWLLI
jgi:hypothetical protein